MRSIQPRVYRLILGTFDRKAITHGYFSHARPTKTYWFSILSAQRALWDARRGGWPNARLGSGVVTWEEE